MATAATLTAAAFSAVPALAAATTFSAVPALAAATTFPAVSALAVLCEERAAPAIQQAIADWAEMEQDGKDQDRREQRSPRHGRHLWLDRAGMHEPHASLAISNLRATKIRAEEVRSRM